MNINIVKKLKSIKILEQLFKIYDKIFYTCIIHDEIVYFPY